MLYSAYLYNSVGELVKTYVENADSMAAVFRKVMLHDCHLKNEKIVIVTK